MTACDDILATLLLGESPDAAATAHLATCARCADEAAAVRDVRGALAADAGGEPRAGLSAGVVRAAAPLLAQNARWAARRTVGRAVAAALVPLPFLLFLDAHLVRAGYDLLRTMLPTSLCVYLVFNYCATLTLLLAASFGAIPILAERQMRGIRV